MQSKDDIMWVWQLIAPLMTNFAMLSLTEENVRIACKEMIDKLKLKMEWKFLSFMVQEGKEVKKKFIVVLSTFQSEKITMMKYGVMWFL